VCYSLSLSLIKTSCITCSKIALLEDMIYGRVDGAALLADVAHPAPAPGVLSGGP
jgi:hypothetical protein